MINSELDIVEEFQSLTGKDIAPFFQKCISFLKNEYVTISYYFSGRIKSISSEPFKIFEELYQENQSLLEIFQNNSYRMNNSKWWELLEYLEDIDSRFNTLRSINRWSRSSLSSFGYNPTAQLQYSILQNQTLERISQDILRNSNPQDDWVNIALDNQLREEDYDNEGGTQLKLNLQRTVNTEITVNSVVDTLYGKSIYGKDIDRLISIKDGDLKVLDFDATIFQAVEILANLKKNDHPDYPFLGLRSSVAVGGNRAVMNFPIIDRQMSTAFQVDDTLKSFQINSINLNQDNLTVEFQVRTRLDEIQTREIIL